MNKNQNGNCCELSDYDMISDVLGNQKTLVKLYTTSLCEVAEEPLRRILENKLSECASDQFDAFCYMSDRGMYKTEQAPQDKITQAQNKFAQCDCGSVCECNNCDCR